MVTINRVIVSKGNNKVDFSGNIPSPADNNNIKVIDLEKGVPTPDVEKISTGNTTLVFSNVVNKKAPKVTFAAGTYSSGAFGPSSDVTYNLEKLGNVAKITGTIKYVDANAEVALSAGHHVILRIAKEGVTKAGLPSGNIVKVTNTTKDGGYNIATKDAFESDGSLVVAVNFSTAVSMALSEPREVMIAWETDKEGELVWTKYIIDASEAKLGAHA